MINCKKNEFKINKYITLVLKSGKTVIHIAGEPFNQCKYLFLINPQERKDQEKITSIDEASEVLGNDLEEGLTLEDLGLSPEDEFWGHCSNIQAWVEFNYDTRLLHSNLSFPLLKRLYQVGDINAKRYFKEEISKRFSSGYPSVQRYLYKEGYLDYLNTFETIFFNLTNLDLSDCDIKIFPDFLFNLKNLKTLNLDGNEICELPKSVKHLKKLKYFSISNNQLNSLSSSISKLKNLTYLDLSNNKLNNNSFFLDINSPFLKEVNLSLNNIQKFPNNLIAIKQIEIIDLSNNNIREVTIPSHKHASLKILDLSYNQIKFLPKTITFLVNLETLILTGNQINYIDESLGELKFLKSLYLDSNNFKYIPEKLGDLPKLKYLRIDESQIGKLPQSLLHKIESNETSLFIIKNKK